MLNKYCIPVILLFFAEVQVSGQKHGDLHGFYGSMNLGIDIVNGNVESVNPGSSAHFAMHLNAGYFITRSIQAGLTLNGWLFEPYGETLYGYRGESLSGSLAHLQVYPVKSLRIFFKSGYGRSNYTNLRPEGNHGKGDVFMLAAGYERKIEKLNLLAGILISYNRGRIKYAYINPGDDNLNRRYQTIDLTAFIALD